MYSNIPLSIKFNICLSSFTYVILRYSVLAYNLDVNNVKVFDVPTTLNHKRGSYFGYSVALYANGEDSVLLVGAPRANSSTLESVIEPGAVYQCPINDTCKEWIIDDTGNDWKLQGYADIYQIKDNAWIGATIAIENRTNPTVVVCGPRWKSNIIRKTYNWYMNGICYWRVINGVEVFEKTDRHIILTNMNNTQITKTKDGTKIYNLGMAEIGFSVHITSNELQRDLVLGSPGVYNWKGSVLLETSLNGNMQTINSSIKDEEKYYYNGYSGKYHVCNFRNSGYAVTSGCYFTQGELWVASGAPGSRNIYGYVHVHRLPGINSQLEERKDVSGNQHGEYFGAAVTSCDLNGDGKDELIVGAPQWAKDMDEGRIYIFTASQNKFYKQQSIDGEIFGSRFGSVVTCLGDIDYDGYADIAVGAPYEEQTGAIYIFNGNSNGLLKRYSQKIIGSQFGKSVRGFGISISDARDVNSDKYPDIAVGAYLSEQVVLIKSKPTVTILTNLTYTDKKKLLRNSTSFLIDSCTSYSGINAPTHIRIVKLLKIDPMYGRAFYHAEKGADNIYKLPETLYISKDSCSQLEIHLKGNIQNVIDPLEISISVILEEDLQTNNQGTDWNLFCTSCAIVNEFRSKSQDLIKLPFSVDCGDDDICTSDVKVTLSTDLKLDNRHIIGSTSSVKFIIDASNRGEPAYQAKTHLYIPEILSLASIPPSCMESSLIFNTLEVICDFGNPLRKNRTLVLELDMRKVRFDVHDVMLWTTFTTQSEEKNSFNKTHNLTIYFDVDANIIIAGKARDDLYSYFLHHEDEEAKLSSLQFQHMYEVQKFGASPIEEVILTISIPTYWKHSTGDIQIININETIGYMDGQQFYCTHSTYLISDPQNHSTHSELNVQEQFSMGTDLSINMPPENRTVYINCTNTDIKCTRIKCELGPFISSSTAAKLSFILDIYLSNFKPNLIEGRDIIYFVSNGSVNIVQPTIISKLGQKPNSTIVATMFLGSPITEKVATATIVLSIVFGILLLTFLVLGLIKLGFFNRKKKEELKALMSETNEEHRITLETNSSREVVD